MIDVEVLEKNVVHFICTTRAQKSCPLVSFAPAGGRHHRAELDLETRGTRPAASLGCCVCVVPFRHEMGAGPSPKVGWEGGGPTM